VWYSNHLANRAQTARNYIPCYFASSTVGLHVVKTLLRTSNRSCFELKSGCQRRNHLSISSLRLMQLGKNDVRQYGPTTRPRALCGPPQRFPWPAEAFRKNLQIWNLLKSVWGYICLTQLLALDKVCFHENNTFCVYNFVSFIYFTNKSEGAARR